MITVFGSINLDFVTRVERIPLPGETVLGPSYSTHPGGKGANQALAARRAGATVALVGAVGQDAFAEVALHLLMRHGVDLTNVMSGDLPTGAAFICVDRAGANAIVVSAGANGLARASQLGSQRLTSADSLILQREVPDGESTTAALLARDVGARVILNPAPGGGVGEHLLKLANVLVMNQSEAASIGTSLQLAAQEPEAIALLLSRRFASTAIVTLGAAGAIARDPDGTVWRATPPAIAAVDTTAAGDAFVGVLAAALDDGRSLGDALIWAVAGGSLACMRNGAQPSLPDRASIAAYTGSVALLRSAEN